MTDLLDAALAAHDAGLCVVPPREDGTKRPHGQWKRWQTDRPDRAQVEAWCSNGRRGLGLVCGHVSGGLEMLELEGRAVDDGLDQDLLDACEQAGLGEVVTRIVEGYSERTPSGGLHLLYRCEETEGNLKLARRADPDTGEIEVLVETRGEGGYVVVAPSAGTVHSTGKPWELLAGGFDSIATVTPDERRALLEVARGFDELDDQTSTTMTPAPVDHDTDSPLDRFDRDHTCDEIFQRNGWTHGRTDSKGHHYTRPGKDRRQGTSATVWADDGTATIFSTSANVPAEYVGDRRLRPSQLAAALEHQGDYGRLTDTVAAGQRDRVEAWLDDIDGQQQPQPGPTADDATPTDRLRSELLTTAQLATLPEPEPLIDGILELDSLALLVAKAGVGKTFLAIDWGACIASGTWWQRRAVTAGNVLYLISEGVRGAPRRVDAWRAVNNVQGLDRLHWLPRRINLLEPAWVAALTEIAADLQVRLLVIDTLARNMAGADENSSKDMGRVVDHLDHLRQATGACVLANHHLGKDSAKGSRGHSSLTGALDTELVLEGDTRHLTLRTAKQKDGAPAPAIQLTTIEAAGSLAIAHPSRRTDTDYHTATVRHVLDTLHRIAGSDGVASKDWLEAVQESPESPADSCGRTAFFEAKRTLESEGRVRNHGTASRPRWSPTTQDKTP